MPNCIIKAFENLQTKALISVMIIMIGFAAICFVRLTDSIHNRIFDLMFLVGTYYFGSSSSATKKDEVISKALDASNTGNQNVDEINTNTLNVGKK